MRFHVFCFLPGAGSQPGPQWVLGRDGAAPLHTLRLPRPAARAVGNSLEGAGAELSQKAAKGSSQGRTAALGEVLLSLLQTPALLRLRAARCRTALRDAGAAQASAEQEHVKDLTIIMGHGQRMQGQILS